MNTIKTIKHIKLTKAQSIELLAAAIQDVGNDKITYEGISGDNYFMWVNEGINYILGVLRPEKGQARGYYHLNAY